MGYKLDKNTILIQKYISEIIQFDIKNKDIGFVTVTHVSVTNDYSYCKVFVSFLDNKFLSSRLQALENVKGIIRSKLANKLSIRKTPQLIFILDDSYQKGQEVEEIFKKIHENESKSK